MTPSRVVVARTVAYEDGYADECLVLDATAGAVVKRAALPRADAEQLLLAPDGAHFLVAGFGGLFYFSRG